MTQEEKELLLKDLCARLPYYPKCEMIDELRVVSNKKDSSYISTLFPKHIELFSYHNNFTIKPYLRPISSMTEEEMAEFKWLNGECDNMPTFNYIPVEHYRLFDWLNRNYFDYRGLIPKGLAIEVTKDNNPYKD